MNNIFARIWAFYTKHTTVRHAVTGVIALVVWNYAEPITQFLQGWLPESVAVLITGGGAAGLARKAQILLEETIRNVMGSHPAPESPAES